MKKLLKYKAESASVSKPKKFKIGSTMVHTTKAIPTDESGRSYDKQSSHKLAHKSSIASLRLNIILKSKTA